MSHRRPPKNGRGLLRSSPRSPPGCACPVRSPAAHGGCRPARRWHARVGLTEVWDRNTGPCEQRSEYFLVVAQTLSHLCDVNHHTHTHAIMSTHCMPAHCYLAITRIYTRQPCANMGPPSCSPIPRVAVGGVHPLPLQRGLAGHGRGRRGVRTPERHWPGRVRRHPHPPCHAPMATNPSPAARDTWAHGTLP